MPSALPASTSHFLLFSALLLCFPLSSLAQNNATNDTASVIVTYDPATARKLALYIALAAAGIYGLFFLTLGVSFIRYRLKVLPELYAIKDVEIEKASMLVSYWPRALKELRDSYWLVIFNLGFAGLNMLGLVVLISSASDTGALIVFFATSFSFFGISVLFMPNHELVVPPPEMAQAHAFSRRHPPVEKDKYYVVSDETLEAWWDRPETWSFETDPWGQRHVMVERAEAVPRLEIPQLPIPKPVQIDEEEEEERRRQEKAAEKRRIVLARKAEELRIRAERKAAMEAANAEAEGGSDGSDDDAGTDDDFDEEEEEEEEEDDDADLDDEEDDDEGLVGPEYEVGDRERQRRLTLAWLVDPRPLVRVAINPPAGVCTVLGDYPLPTWQRVSYFEVYLCSGEPNVNCVVGLATRPYPQWRFPGWDPVSVGYHSRGCMFVSTCDFEKPYSMPWGSATNEDGNVNDGPWQNEIRTIQDEIYSRHPAAIAKLDPELKEAREACQTWDCVGVMYNRKTGRVRFSLNGRLLQPACHMPNKLFYPAIAADAQCEFRVNFGTQPFYCTDFNYLVHGCGRTLRDPEDEEGSDSEDEDENGEKKKADGENKDGDGGDDGDGNGGGDDDDEDGGGDDDDE